MGGIKQGVKFPLFIADTHPKLNPVHAVRTILQPHVETQGGDIGHRARDDDLAPLPGLGRLQPILIGRRRYPFTAHSAARRAHRIEVPRSREIPVCSGPVGDKVVPKRVEVRSQVEGELNTGLQCLNRSRSVLF